VDPPFEVGVEQHPGETVVAVSGELDVFSAPRLRQILFDPVLCARPTIVVDLTDVDFMDSTGIGTLVAARRWLTSRGATLTLVCPEGPVLRLLALVSLDKVFDVHATIEAVRSA
jgi:anti-sigma B factor antagonist